MKSLRITGIALAWLLLTAQTGDSGFEDTLDEAFGKDTLIISADRHACWFFDIYVANDRAQQMRGLMHVRALPEFTGMIFIYRQAGIRSMWMKNTYIPLDMLFIRGDGSVASVIENTTPLSLESRRWPPGSTSANRVASSSRTWTDSPATGSPYPRTT
jgi:uncharacterized membrane protein (UPF0127 family)